VTIVLISEARGEAGEWEAGGWRLEAGGGRREAEADSWKG
jgi:hypothetical protein